MIILPFTAMDPSVQALNVTVMELLEPIRDTLVALDYDDLYSHTLNRENNKLFHEFLTAYWYLEDARFLLHMLTSIHSASPPDNSCDYPYRCPNPDAAGECHLHGS